MKRPIGVVLLSIFFAGGALICLVTMLALAFPRTLLDSIWRLKPEAQVQFLQIGRFPAILLMAVVGTACGLAALGLARTTEWGRRLAIGILVVNLAGDSLTAWVRHDPQTLIGLPIGGFMIWCLVRLRQPRRA